MITSACEVSSKEQSKERDVLLKVVDLKKYFSTNQRLLSRHSSTVKAVDGISFSVRKGETLGLVGESGSGKTTTGRAILRLIEPTAGQVEFKGINVLTASDRILRGLRAKMQIIFQDPYDSLNPRMKVGDLVGEPLRIHQMGTPLEQKEKVRNLLKLVGLEEYSINRYAHEFSGGQRQRIGIARSLALQPELIVCDEPVSALDVSIQSQILNLLVRLQDRFGFAYIFTAHNLGVIKHMSDRIAVMYLGKIVELAPKHTLFSAPKHPYTEALLSAIPVPDPEVKNKRIVLQGDIPSPIDVPSGCRFHTRCPYAMPQCSKTEPKYLELRPEHFVACHLAQ